MDTPTETKSQVQHRTAGFPSSSGKSFNGFFSGDKRWNFRKNDLIDARARRLFETTAYACENDAYPFQIPLEGRTGPQVKADGHSMLMLSSYDYLGLIGDPRIDAAAIEAIRKYGTGTGGARLLTGTTLRDARHRVRELIASPELLDTLKKKRPGVEVVAGAGVRNLIAEGRIADAVEAYRSFMGVDKFTAEQAIGYTRKVREAGAAVTWDVPVQMNGTISQPFVDQLTALGKALATNSSRIFARPTRSPISCAASRTATSPMSKVASIPSRISRRSRRS